MKKITIRTDAGYDIVLTHFEPETEGDNVVLIVPANGVKQSFYSGFAVYLCNQNIAAFTFDYGGIGESKNGDLRSFDTSIINWGKNDLEAVLSHIKTVYSDKKLKIIAHSMGGQIIGLAPSSVNADKFIFTAVPSGYWRFWKGFERVKMLNAWYVLFPVLTNIFGYMPTSRVSSMEDLPKSVARQWRKWCLNPNYMFDYLDDLETNYERHTCRLVSYSIENDTFAPKEAVDWLTEKYVNTQSERIHLRPDDFGVDKIGHFGFFK
ncbi:MAG: serine aminopeptidase domain-containing protein, partial [Balneolaceae bacterium]